MKLLLNDTSVLLNLLAAGCLGEVAADLDWQFAICPAVRDEATKLYDSEVREMVRLDLAPLITSGLLQVLELMGEAEEVLYVEQSIVVDDGEAMSLAIAVNREMELAMDNRQASNHARRTFVGLKLWSSPEILKQWADTVIVPAGRLQEIIRLIETRARYQPSRLHPLADWWDQAKYPAAI